MKRGYLETSLLLLLLHCISKMATARHHLFPCLRCPTGYGVSRPCSRSQGTECSRCASGRTYSSHASAHRPCYPCSRCGTGLYVAHACTPERDTICDSCHTYRGPHNRDFFEKCIQPLQHNDTESWDPESRVSSPISVSSSLLIGAGAAAATLAVVLTVTCVVLYSRKRCKRVQHLRYPYQAVATQEAVML